jgi:uncharacterized DUF497 family protein
MRLAWHEAKRQAALRQRGVDFAAARELFDGVHFTAADLRKD